MAKPSKTFSNLFMAFMALLPLLQVPSLQDDTLLSRFLLLDLFVLSGLVLLWKDLKSIQLTKLPVLSLGLFLLFLILSAFSALNISESWGSLARYASFIPAFVVLEIAFRLKRINGEDLLKAAVLFAGVAALPTLFQLLKSLASGEFFDDIYTITGTFSHKNLLASALMLSFPFVLAAWAGLKGMWSKSAMVLAIILIVELFVLRTRGVWLGLIVASGLTALVLQISKPKDLQISKKWGIALSALALVILAALFLSPQIKAGFTNSSNVQKRLVFWENTQAMIQEKPLSGVGLGNWRLYFPKYGLNEVDENTRQGITHIQRPHNDYLWIWAEAGPFALLAFLALFFFAFRQVIQNLKASEGPQRYLNLAALFGLIAYMSFSFGDFPIERAPHTLWLMIMLAFISHQAKAEWKAKWPSYLAVVLVLFAFFVNYQRFKAEQGMEAVLQANASQNAAAIVTSAEKVYSDWYTVDNYANPLNYYSAKGYLFTNRPQEAFEDLEQSMKDAPFNILVYESFAQYYARQNELEQALDYAARGLEISPQFKMLLLLKAEIHLQRKEFADALEALNMHEPRSGDQRYQQDLATALRGTLQTYSEHGRFSAMMEHLQQSGPLERPEDYIRAYRIKRGIQ